MTTTTKPPANVTKSDTETKPEAKPDAKPPAVPQPARAAAPVVQPVRDQRCLKKHAVNCVCTDRSPIKA